jgi:hypothetical protein
MAATSEEQIEHPHRAEVEPGQLDRGTCKGAEYTGVRTGLEAGSWAWASSGEGDGATT